MLKNLIEKSVSIKVEEEKDKARQKKGEDKAPFQYDNELEILVYKRDKLVETYKNK